LQHLTMSNSHVALSFFQQQLRSLLFEQQRPSCSHRPQRGVDGAPTGALFILCRACEARRPRLRADLSRCDRDPSRRSTVAIFGRAPTLTSPAVGHRSRSDCPRQGTQCPAAGVRTSRGAVSRRSRGTPLPAPSVGSSPEDAPPERGCDLVRYIRYVVKKYLQIVAINATTLAVMRGLDPRIHRSSQDDGSPGQAQR
jgi:hypothetical protein